MGICEKCEHRDNPIGVCCNKGGKIKCKILKEALKTKRVKDEHKEVALNQDVLPKGLFRKYNIKHYINPELPKSVQHFNKFKKIARKKVGKNEEYRIKEQLFHEYFDTLVGISKIKERPFNPYKGEGIRFNSSIYSSKTHISLDIRALAAFKDGVMSGQQADKEKAIKWEQEDSLVKQALKPLTTDKQFQAFYDSKIANKTEEEIAREMGISHQAVNKLKKKVYKKLENKYGGLQKGPNSERLYSHIPSLRAYPEKVSSLPLSHESVAQASVEPNKLNVRPGHYRQL